MAVWADVVVPLRGCARVVCLRLADSSGLWHHRWTPGRCTSLAVLVRPYWLTALLRRGRFFDNSVAAGIRRHIYHECISQVGVLCGAGAGAGALVVAREVRRIRYKPCCTTAAAMFRENRKVNTGRGAKLFIRYLSVSSASSV